VEEVEEEMKESDEGMILMSTRRPPEDQQQQQQDPQLHPQPQEQKEQQPQPQLESAGVESEPNSPSSPSTGVRPSGSEDEIDLRLVDMVRENINKAEMVEWMGSQAVKKQTGDLWVQFAHARERERTQAEGQHATSATASAAAIPPAAPTTDKTCYCDFIVATRTQRLKYEGTYVRDFERMMVTFEWQPPTNLRQLNGGRRSSISSTASARRSRRSVGDISVASLPMAPPPYLLHPNVSRSTIETSAAQPVWQTFAAARHPEKLVYEFFSHAEFEISRDNPSSISQVVRKDIECSVM
jgi:hypothetical protein